MAETGRCLPPYDACRRFRMDGNVRFLLPMASTVSLEMLAKFADSNCNPFISQFNWGCGVVQQPKVLSGKLEAKEQCKGMLVTHNGVQIEILQQFPPYHLYKQCTLCLTTVGANTAELGNLAIPMIVVVPTFVLDVFKGAAGGMLGMMTNIPGWLGNMVARMVNASVVHSIDYFAWPNRWAGQKVVPELIGEIEPEEVAIVAASYLMEDTHLDVMREQLQDLAKKHCNIGHEMVLLSSPGASKSVAIATEELLV